MLQLPFLLHFDAIRCRSDQINVSVEVSVFLIIVVPALLRRQLLPSQVISRIPEADEAGPGPQDNVLPNNQEQCLLPVRLPFVISGQLR